MKLKQKWYRRKTTTKNDVFFCWVELTFGGEGRGERANFWLVGTPPIPKVGKTLYIYVYIYYTYAFIKELCQQVFIYNKEAPCTSHTCAKVAILLLSTLSVTDIYGIYFHLSVQCS